MVRREVYESNKNLKNQKLRTIELAKNLTLYAQELLKMSVDYTSKSQTIIDIVKLIFEGDPQANNKFTKNVIARHAARYLLLKYTSLSKLEIAHKTGSKAGKSSGNSIEHSVATSENFMVILDGYKEKMELANQQILNIGL